MSRGQCWQQNSLIDHLWLGNGLVIVMCRRRLLLLINDSGQMLKQSLILLLKKGGTHLQDLLHCTLKRFSLIHHRKVETVNFMYVFPLLLEIRSRFVICQTREIEQMMTTFWSCRLSNNTISFLVGQNQCCSLAKLCAWLLQVQPPSFESMIITWVFAVTTACSLFFKTAVFRFI